MVLNWVLPALQPIQHGSSSSASLVSSATFVKSVSNSLFQHVFNFQSLSPEKWPNFLKKMCLMVLSVGAPESLYGGWSSHSQWKLSCESSNQVLIHYLGWMPIKQTLGITCLSYGSGKDLVSESVVGLLR